jgi:glycosyltransferase involved in cell wall biosynthesis
MSSELNHFKNILMVYIEPTPYIVGLVNALVETWQGDVDVLFLGENNSQNWNMELNNHWKILNGKLKNKMIFISKLIFSNQYEVVHVAGWREPLIILTIILSKLRRIPVVIETDTALPKYLSLWKKIGKRLVYPVYFKFINLFLPGGKRQAKYLEYYGVKKNRIIEAKMTVDIEYIKKISSTLAINDKKRICEKYNIPHNKLIFLFVGRLIEEKGIKDLIDAFNKLKQDNIFLLIVGDGCLRTYVENKIKNNEKICYAGRIIAKELIEILYTADILVLPSHYEPWGLVVNEAMAMGRPVIVSDQVGCIDDLVTHQQTGLIIKSGSIRDLIDAIEFMINNENRRLMMGRESAIKISDWTLANEANNLCRAWNSLINI